MKGTGWSWRPVSGIRQAVELTLKKFEKSLRENGEGRWLIRSSWMRLVFNIIYYGYTRCNRGMIE